MAVHDNSGAHTAAERGAASGGYNLPSAAQNENGTACYRSPGACLAGQNENSPACLHPSARAAGQDENLAAYLPPGPHAAAQLGAAHRGCGLPCACESEKDAAYLDYGVPIAGQNENGAAHFLHGVRKAVLNEIGAAGARAADQNENGAANLSSGRYGLPSMAMDNNGAAYLEYDVPVAGQNESDSVYLDHDMSTWHGVAGFESEHMPGFVAGRGSEVLLYRTRTAAAATEPGAEYYTSGMVAGEALPPAAQVQVLVDKATGGPAAVIGREKDAVSFAERMRGGLPVVGLAAACAAVTGLATSKVTPASGFSLFLVMLCGLSLATIRILRA